MAAMGNPYESWRRRHRNPVSFWLHLVGIPACFAAAPVLLLLRRWWLGAACFVGGYLLQFIGHWFEGNRSGEEILLRRILGHTQDDSPQGPSGPTQDT